MRFACGGSFRVARLFVFFVVAMVGIELRAVSMPVSFVGSKPVELMMVPGFLAFRSELCRVVSLQPAQRGKQAHDHLPLVVQGDFGLLELLFHVTHEAREDASGFLFLVLMFACHDDDWLQSAARSDWRGAQMVIGMAVGFLGRQTVCRWQKWRATSLGRGGMGNSNDLDPNRLFGIRLDVAEKVKKDNA